MVQRSDQTPSPPTGLHARACTQVCMYNHRYFQLLHLGRWCWPFRWLVAGGWWLQERQVLNQQRGICR